MKKLKGLFCTLVILLLMPFTVLAEGKDKINVYIFRGEGCGFCAKALTFFEELDDEYQSYFNLVEKEVWSDEENAEQMQKVASYFNENVQGVPYIIIGDKTFQGFDEEEYGEEIKAAIKNSYENKDGSYKDVVATILSEGTIAKEDNNSAVTIIVIIAAIAGIGFLIYMARDNEAEDVIEEETKEVKKNSPKSESNTKKKTTKKKTIKK